MDQAIVSLISSGGDGLDPLIAPLLEMGSTGALVAIILTAFKAIEVRSSKKSGGSLHIRVSALEVELTNNTAKLSKCEERLESFHRDFREFREEVRLSWARQQAREEVIKEVTKNCA